MTCFHEKIFPPIFINSKRIIFSFSISQWLDPSQNGFQRVSTLKSGLEASCVLISIMNTPQIDRRLIIEDGIIACVDLLRQHVGKSVVMSISNTGHLWFNRNQSSVGKPQRDRKRKRSDIAQREFPQDKKVDKKQNVKNSQSLVEPLKQIYKVILSTLGTLHFFIERMENLIQNVQLDDQPILSIASTCLATFAIDPQKASNISKVYTIQISTLSLVFSIFQRYQKHRAIILEDLFPLMLKIPRTKKMMRTFPVRSSMVNHPMYTSKVVDPRYLENSNIQPIAALILSLIQGCVTMPIHQEKEQEGNNIRNLSNGLSDCTQVCNFFTVQLLRRCSRKGVSPFSEYLHINHVLFSTNDSFLLLRKKEVRLNLDQFYPTLLVISSICTCYQSFQQLICFCLPYLVK